MMRSSSRERWFTAKRAVPALSVAALLGIGLLSGSATTATAGATSETVRHPAPVSDAAIPNLTVVQNQIKDYYGDTVTGTEHNASPNSSYARQLKGIQRGLKAYLDAKTRVPAGKKKPAVVFDVDDTTLLTYNYTVGVGFAYDAVSNDKYIQAQKMTEVFGMPELVNWAAKRGITVFYLTGRPESQRTATEGNLAKVGYTAKGDKDHLFLKNKENPPPYLECGKTCTSVQYKSGTRAYLESKGYRILATVGDQYSDLKGGHAERTVKFPNPMYYLP